MVSCKFERNDFFKRQLNKSMQDKLDVHKCIMKFMHKFLNFACAAIIGDNVDTAKSVILMLAEQ